MPSFLYCFLYIYALPTNCDSNSCQFFNLLKAIAKIFLLSLLLSRKSDSWKSDDFREINQEKNQRTDTKKEAKVIKSDNFKKEHYLKN